MTERTPRLMTRQQPHIETLQVSVQVIRVGSKQMTLAVFRQLKTESVIDLDTLELRGVPWGTVHYKPGDCPPEVASRDHLHVVWQTGEELRRACLALEHPEAVRLKQGLVFSANSMLRATQMLLLIDILAMRDTLIQPDIFTDVIPFSTRTWHCQEFGTPLKLTFTLYAIGDLLDHATPQLPRCMAEFERDPREFTWRYVEREITSCLSVLAELARLADPKARDRLTIQQHIQALAQEYQTKQERLVRLNTRWQEHVEEIEALPQLFIAV